jgi:hypothetical protein
MKKLTVVGTAVVIVLIIGWIVYRAKRPQGFAPPVPTSCPAPKPPIKCPGPGDVDANGCPKGGYDANKGECAVTFAYYKEYAGCTDEHNPTAFYTKASPGNPSKYHLISGTAFDIQAAFTEIDCKTHNAVAGAAVNAGKPFLRNFNDDFSEFKQEHISADADPAMIGKCFKVTVNLREGPDCIDPHIIVKGL